MDFQRSIFIINLLLLACLNTVTAKGKQDTYQVYINTPDQSIRAYVLTSPVKSPADLELTYYWYASNKIIGTKGGFDGKLLHGEYSAFYLNNQLKEKGLFRKGLKHGRWITWYDNGNIKDITEWKNGKKHGVYRSFTSKGEPMLEAHFENDKLHGKVTSYENGKVLSSKRYKNGEEIIKQPKQKKEKKTGSKDVDENPATKEGVNTTTPPENPKKKRSIREKVKSSSPGEKETKQGQDGKEKQDTGKKKKSDEKKGMRQEKKRKKDQEKKEQGK